MTIVIWTLRLFIYFYIAQSVLAVVGRVGSQSDLAGLGCFSIVFIPGLAWSLLRDLSSEVVSCGKRKLPLTCSCSPARYNKNIKQYVGGRLRKVNQLG